MNDLNKFEKFLEGIDLTHYRKQYAHIKLVELDLPREIQAIRHLYREYWENREGYLDYEKFYQIYRRELSDKICAFRKKQMFSKETFERGLPARIYRTWASLLTQIQAGYAAEMLYGKGHVKMSADLDYKGIDIQLMAKRTPVNIQIKKETLSREVRKPMPINRRGVKILEIIYEVPGVDPLTPKKGLPSKRFVDWQNKWEGKLKRLNNGFIIFLPAMFQFNAL